MKTSIYVIEAAHGAVKIGHSKSPGARCRQIQIGNSSVVRVVWAADMARTDAIKIESVVHRKLRRTVNYQRGEWYLLKASIAVEVIRSELESCKIMWTPNMQYAVERNVAFS